ncbi:hypothetical protein BofuT4_uP087150.1 [Botrytis cinerea T4]|uniref:Secreted protein n=1 Tax=Botryotinia fuckeliana (strain T4) TaxID=999810 RepID=G2YGB3_BOTF4|nr:hypothetical protein BofuT4_uP087150.1 [Botrytis cinerea T4]
MPFMLSTVSGSSLLLVMEIVKASSKSARTLSHASSASLTEHGICTFADTILWKSTTSTRRMCYLSLETIRRQIQASG